MPPHDRARLVHREGRRVQHDDVARGLGRPRADAGAAQAEASLDGQAVYQRVLASWSQLPADDVVVPRRRARRHEPHGLAGADPGRAADPGWRDGTLPRPAWPGPLLCHTPDQPGQWRPCVLRRCISPGRRAPLPLRPACAAAQARGGGTSEGVLGELRGPGPAGLQALQLAHRSRPGGAGPGLSTPFTTSRSPAGNSVLDASVRHSARGLSPPTPPPNPPPHPTTTRTWAQVSFGPISWLLAGEVFPLKVS